MKVYVASESRFVVAPDNSVWIRGASSYEFWTRYLDVYDEVIVIARVRGEDKVPEGYNRADGLGVSFASVPFYKGPGDFLRQYRHVKNAVSSLGMSDGAVVLRMPGQIASIVESSLITGYPFAVEVVGDPEDVFGKGAVHHPLRRFFRYLYSRQLRRAIQNSKSVAYVTSNSLQARYPARDNVFSTHYSSVMLEDSDILKSPRPAPSLGVESLHCITVGSLDQMYKGTDVLIKAIAVCRNRGMRLKLTVIGDGRHRQALESLTETLGVAGEVHFAGQVASGEPVRNQLDKADLFVLPSRTEGLPRAMIEAMARGLPCIGTRVGGIPELLGPEFLVPPDDAEALAAKMLSVLSDDALMSKMSQDNLSIASQYKSEQLSERRNEHYAYLRERTFEWHRNKRLG